MFLNNHNNRSKITGTILSAAGLMSVLA
ncbi:MAG: hypothetical protein ACD_68C00128G0001, partial [uncultured bacterium]